MSAPPRKLRVAADPLDSPAWHLVAMLQPFLPSPNGLTSYQLAVTGQWMNHAQDQVELAPLGSSDIAVLPFALEAISVMPELWYRAVALAETARAAGKAMLVFCHGDRYIPAPSENCVMLRTSLHRSRRSPRDVALPAWVHDPCDVVPVGQREFSPRPSVGFVGQAYPLEMVETGRLGRGVKWVKWSVRSALTTAQLAGLLAVPPDTFTRVAALMSVRHSRHVQPRVQVRSRMTRLDLGLAADRGLHREFLEAIHGSDYTLAVSGLGNYSYRLYEALASGRPVVVVDTDLELPGGHRLPWDRVAVRVRPRELPRLGKIVAERHLAWGPEGFARAQHLSREVWVNDLSADGFLTTMTSRILSVLDASRPPVSPERIAAVLR